MSDGFYYDNYGPQEDQMILALDFDHTIVDGVTPKEGARDAINLLRERGWKILVHSCNQTKHIEQTLNNCDIRYDWIWDQKGKPVADCYLDDLGLRFTKWDKAVRDIEEFYGT